MTEITRLDLPVKNLLLTGYLGVGKTTIGHTIANQLGVDFFDLDEEIEMREYMSISKLREQYGDQRLKALEHDLCQQAALMRRSVVVLSGAALLDARNFALMEEISQIVCLTCELGEALRRLHLGSEQHYRDVNIRRRMLARLRRERPVVNDPRLLQMDTTHVPSEEVVELLINLWATGDSSDKHFRSGPPEPVRPPERIPMGLASPTRPPNWIKQKE
jgi:shikimate kinase